MLTVLPNVKNTSTSYERHLFVKKNFLIIGLASPLFIELSVPSHTSEQSCICVLEVSSFASFYDIGIGVLSCSDTVIFIVFHFIKKH